jgi:7-cyano-7-deazaguanine synthase
MTQLLEHPKPGVTAVLLSGGLDSAVLLAEEARRSVVRPVYVRVGLAWEAAEREAVALMLASPAFGSSVGPLASLAVDMTDVYPAAHWARTGQPPGYHTRDEDVYLLGRNIVLLAKAAVFCAGAGIGKLLMGTLDHNPFPDATPAFRTAMAAALSEGLAHGLSIEAPYARTSKADVIRRGTAAGVPLDLTLSCMNPVRGAAGPPAEVSPARFPRHCGLCSKCRERHEAFLEAGVADPTDYVSSRFVGR